MARSTIQSGVRKARLGRFWLFLFPLPVIFLQGNVWPQNPDSGSGKNEPVANEIAVAATFSGVDLDGQGLHFALVDLGTVTPGSNTKVLLTLRSDAANDFTYRGIGVNCRCVKLEPLEGTIRSLADFPMMAVVAVPPATPDSTYSASVELLREGKTPAKVNFSMQLGGNLYVPPVPSFVVSDNRRDFAVPFVFSEPISRNTLTLDGATKLEYGVRADLVIDEGAGKVVIRFDPAQLDNEFHTCDLVLCDSATGKNVPFQVVYGKSRGFVVSPRVLQFQSEKPAGAVWQATAILELDEDLAQTVASAGPAVQCTLDREPVKVELVRLNDRFYRATIQTDTGPSGTEFVEGEWTIQINGKSWCFPAKAMFRR